jgi:hypothetical protein
MLRHNTSDGYWSQGYNIYPGYHYMDREGKIFTSEECISEFKEYNMKNNFYKEKVKQIYRDFPNVATIR